MEVSAPAMPTVAVNAASRANCVGGNHAAAIFSVPTNVAAAPRPTRKRPVKSAAVPAAPPITSAPTPMTAPPSVSTRRAP